MSNNDPLANVLSHILNYEKKGKKLVDMAENRCALGNSVKSKIENIVIIKKE